MGLVWEPWKMMEKAPALSGPAYVTQQRRGWSLWALPGVRCRMSVGALGGWGTGGHTWQAPRWDIKVQRAECPVCGGRHAQGAREWGPAPSGLKRVNEVALGTPRSVCHPPG